MNLSLKQKEIIEFTDGSLLVTAKLGSGKTRILVERIKFLLNHTNHGKVLVLTLNSLAANELQSRLEEDIACVDSLKRATVGSIHSFCRDLVQSRNHMMRVGSKGMDETLIRHYAGHASGFNDTF